MKISVSTQQLNQLDADVYITFVQQAKPLPKQVDEVISELFPNLEELAAARGFTGAEQDTMVLPLPHTKKRAQHVILVGMGNREKATAESVEAYRRMLAKAIRTATGLKARSVALNLPTAKLFGVSAEYLAEQTVIIVHMTTYHFDEFITQQDRKEKVIQEIILCTDAKNKAAIAKVLTEATYVAEAINMVRHWVDSPPLNVTPRYLATKAEHIAKEYGLKCTVFDEKEVIKMGMGGLAGVSRGSDIDCYLTILEYKTKKKNAPTIALVGKGITFDSGGLSLKPAQHMETMKEDMSGAAAVIGTMQVIAQLQPDVNVIGLTPLSENLPSGKATKPGDILRFYNGKTAEIKNTDAEGRLILADALSYAVKHYKLDAVIDIATLTGACAYALGPFYTGLMTPSDDMAKKLIEAGQASGDYVWRLPMSDDYKRAIRSEVADMCNIGDNRIKAGAVTAAHFLQNFVDDVPWAHLDIAGTAFDVPNIPYYRAGATGAGLRLLTTLVMNWK